MKVVLTIRPAKSPGRVKIATDMKRESGDTPRISNLGLDIKNTLDRLVDDSAKVCNTKD